MGEVLTSSSLLLSGPSEPSLKQLTSPQFGSHPEATRPALKQLGKPHVESFNFMLEEGLAMAVSDLEPEHFSLPQTGERIRLRIMDARIERPTVSAGTLGVRTASVFPAEMRQRAATYKGKFVIKLGVQVDERPEIVTERYIGSIPMMLHSKMCNLSGLSPAQLVERGEQQEDWGGVFVIGGHERILRMLQTTRRNYPVAMQRGGWKNRGKNFSDLGILLACGKRDLTTTNNVLHYLTTGTAKLMFNVGRELFFVPLIMVLKCLVDKSDAAIYAALTDMSDEQDHFYRKCLKNMLVEPQDQGLFSAQQVKNYVGKTFRQKLQYRVPSWYSDEQICDYLMRSSVCVHLESNEDKFNLLALMTRKLFALVQDKCVVEGVDSLMMHELVLGGHLYLQLLKERMANWLTSLRIVILMQRRNAKSRFELSSSTLESCLRKTSSIETSMEKFLATGNLPSATNIAGLMQNKGLTIMAENINRMRYMSHFRAIHRGSFFQEMRTTEVRALLPDAWGFVCPVHTPDGAPCGLLNHLALPVEVVTHSVDTTNLLSTLLSLGMMSLETKCKKRSFAVMLDGRVVGRVSVDDAEVLVHRLRVLKIRSDVSAVPAILEIVLVPIVASNRAPGQFPGLYLFSGPARMMRPVLNIALNAVEWIGTFEQIFLDISINKEEIYPDLTTHMELRSTSFLSNLASTIPLPDFNQSPRNMYQCQMGKQTMGTPIHNWPLNAETKLYRLQTPQSPLFRPAHYDLIGMDDYAMGTNAVVAVISYTGYDMEDAMIINKASLERGFAAGSIYKSQFVDLTLLSGSRKAEGRKQRVSDLVFARDPAKIKSLAAILDQDGLPYVGAKLEEGDPLFCYHIVAEDKYKVKRYEGKETVYIDSVKACGNNTGTGLLNHVCITFRIERNPSVGDKFASRAGQKGICSWKWPSEDLPWSESGIVPDIIFNPHGFPSRMTIAMMVECMAGKSAATNGRVYDASPFRFGESLSKHARRTDAIDYFGQKLSRAGFNYYGNETLYSGVYGTELRADIFFGVIHYQRLRHMVSDKFQVRSTGPVDVITRQPIKGRRRGGGVRFGEMERDALLSHGTMFLLQDRLFHNSDKARVKVCTNCGSILSPRVLVATNKRDNYVSPFRDYPTICVICKKESIDDLELPYVFVHLVSQLASVNIKLRLETKHV